LEEVKRREDNNRGQIRDNRYEKRDGIVSENLDIQIWILEFPQKSILYGQKAYK
jgi:hypothetical protein